MKQITSTLFLLAFTAGCIGFYSNIYKESLPLYSPEFIVTDNKLTIRLDCRKHFWIYKIDHRFKDNHLYLSAHSSSAIGDIETYEIDLSKYPITDLKNRLFWLNPDDTTEQISPDLIKYGEPEKNSG